MGEIILTKDSDALLCALYKEYMQKRKAGVSKRSAKCFGNAKHIQSIIVPKWDIGDIEETCWELARKGFLLCLSANNTIHMASLGDEGIIYMENRFRSGLDEVLDYLEKIKSILLW